MSGGSGDGSGLALLVFVCGMSVYAMALPVLCVYM